MLLMLFNTNFVRTMPAMLCSVCSDSGIANKNYIIIAPNTD